MKPVITMVLWMFCAAVQAVDIRTLNEVGPQPVVLETPEFLLTHEQPFYGLAAIYNSVQPFYLIDDSVVFVDPQGSTPVPAEASQIGWKSRHAVALIEHHPNLEVRFTDNQLQLSANQPTPVSFTTETLSADSQWQPLRYAHLWDWLRYLALGIEWLLQAINQWVGHWGWSVVCLSVVMKLLLLPVGLLTQRFQQQVSRNQSLLAPRLAEIKQKYTGEQAHNEMMALHKELGISPFHELKPLLSNFIQIPILVAIFNVLGEMTALKGEAFLWINDLSLPDTLFDLGVAIPLLGSGFNLLPFVMTAITLVSTITYQNKLAPASQVKKQKTNLYLMALAFFVLFYPFPAAMVLYWAMANVWQLIQQKLMGN